MSSGSEEEEYEELTPKDVYDRWDSNDRHKSYGQFQAKNGMVKRKNGPRNSRK